MRLIDADALKKHYAWWEDDKQKLFDSIVDQQPTVDAVPVRHGKWTADETLYTQGMVACSCCKADYYRDDLYMVGYALRELPKYCPNCGARMDKE